MSVGVTSAINWCGNSSVTGYPTKAISVSAEACEDKVEIGVGSHLFEIAPLLDVGLLIDDASLQRSEVSRDIARKVIGNVFLQPVFPAPPAGSALQAAVLQVAITRSTEVK